MRTILIVFCLFVSASVARAQTADVNDAPITRSITKLSRQAFGQPGFGSMPSTGCCSARGMVIGAAIGAAASGGLAYAGLCDYRAADCVFKAAVGGGIFGAIIGGFVGTAHKPRHPTIDAAPAIGGAGRGGSVVVRF